MSGDPGSNLRSRTLLVYGALVLFGLAIVVQLFRIQVMEGQKWIARADHVATAYRTVQPDRGHIYSADGRLLATSIPEYEVRMDTRADGLSDEVLFANIDSLSLALSRLFGDRTPDTYKRNILDARARGERYYLLKRKVGHSRIAALKKFPLFREGRYVSGLIIEKRTKRKLPFGRLASRTVGSVLADNSAYGLEGGYDKWLRGVTGHRLERRLTGGVWMPVDDGNGQDPLPGSDIRTTIDINLQDLVDNALEAQLRKHGAQYGCVVVMEVETGYIKAICNLTRRSDSTYQADLNYAIGTSTEPGSTFKTAALMVGIEDGLIEPSDSVDTEGGTTRFHDRIMRDSHDGGYGRITVQRALEVSSNVGISKVINKAYAKEPQRFVNGLRRMGLDRPVGVPIPGEGHPVIRNVGDKGWSGVSLPWMSIGYEVALTPLQTLAFYNAIANGGKYMKPQLVSAITQGDKVVMENEPVVVNERICSPATLQKVQRMLAGVVDSGTAVNLRKAHFHIAGKTGTAQIARNKSGYKSEGISYQASFVGYFPAEAPKYSCIVVVNGPTTSGYYGNVVAGPIFREIADKIHSNRLELQTGETQLAATPWVAPVSFCGNARDLDLVFNRLHIPHSKSDDSEWVITRSEDSLVTMLPRAIPGDALHLAPNVQGMGLRDALYILENNGLRVKVLGSGMVRRQSIRPGERISRGSTITIELG